MQSKPQSDMLFCLQRVADIQSHNDEVSQTGRQPANRDPDAGNPLANV